MGGASTGKAIKAPPPIQKHAREMFSVCVIYGYMWSSHAVTHQKANFGGMWRASILAFLLLYYRPVGMSLTETIIHIMLYTSSFY